MESEESATKRRGNRAIGATDLLRLKEHAGKTSDTEIGYELRHRKVFGKEGAMSTWWLAYGFLLGGMAGILVFALMNMAQKEEDRAARAEKTVELQLLGFPQLDPHWGAKSSPKPARSSVSEEQHDARMAA